MFRNFVLYWTDTPYVEWTNENIANRSFIKPINWRINYNDNKRISQQVIVGYVDEHIEQYIPIQETYYHNISLLKSLLQKCIRRQLTDIAIKTAYHILKMDANMLVRRLFIIMLEDVCPHSSLSILAWLTSAMSKGFRLQKKHIEWIIGLVKYLCEETQAITSRYKVNKNYSTILMLEHAYKLDHKVERDTIYSILFRCSYGGLKCDLNMLCWYAEMILSKEINIKTNHFDNVNIDTIKPLKIDEIILESADFHCFPRILVELNKRYEKYNMDILKKVLWICNSRTNTRLTYDIDKDLLKIWEDIMSTTRKIQFYLIRRYM